MYGSYSSGSSSSNDGSSGGEGSSADALDALAAAHASGAGMRRRGGVQGGDDEGRREGNVDAGNSAAGIDPAILQWSRYLGYDGGGNIPAGGIPRNSSGRGKDQQQQQSLLSLRSDVLLAMRYEYCTCTFKLTPAIPPTTCSRVHGQ